ncbi:MAG TPA: class I SAM-dependent methyltransferase [Candidatus Nanoarchaeia archaeon]|nr:class I SAM-dependent methyltransferase [Candidatus Nanoarchaeia archaeon]
MKTKIKNWWENHLPQDAYSSKKINTKPYFDEQEQKRYEIYYKYFPEILKWDKWKGKKVLEIGCGGGTDILQFAKNGAIVTGIDLTETAIKITKRRFDIYNLKGTFIQADAENLPFEDNTFDFVYSLGVLHHTPDTEKAIREAYRVLRPNGKILIHLYAKGWKHYIFRKFYFRFMSESKKDKNTEEWGAPLLKVYSKRQFEKLFPYKIKATKYRMGVFFDYKSKAFGMTLFPKPIAKLIDILKLERLFGENWVGVGIKSSKTRIKEIPL